MTDQPALVERTVKYATTVTELPAAWAFVMEHLDESGPDPEITIRPVWIMPVGEMVDGLGGADVRPAPREFEVTVSGMQRIDGGVDG